MRSCAAWRGRVADAARVAEYVEIPATVEAERRGRTGAPREEAPEESQAQDAPPALSAATAHPPRMMARSLAAALLVASADAFVKPKCVDVDCAFLGKNATRTGRHAVFMAGRIRVAHDALQRLRPIIRRRYGARTNVTVDWFFHLWYNSSSLCERKTLEEFKAFAYSRPRRNLPAVVSELSASRPRRRRDPASAEGAAATHLRGRRRRDLRQRTTSTGNPFAGRPSPSSRSSACGAGARGGRTSGTASTSRTRRWRSSAGRPTSTRPSRNRASTCCTFAARSSTSRGDAAAATRIFLRRIAATPRPRRVNSAGTSRGAATRIVRGDETRARRYDDLDLEGIYAKYSASPAARRSGGHFAVLGINQGWDVHMVATPPLARAFSVYRRDEGYGCDSTKDSFPWQRMGRHGCWPPPDDAAQIVRGSHCGPRDKKKDGFCNFKEIAKRLMPAQWRGRAPRCAPLFVDYFPSKIARSYPFAQNPNTEPRLGCTGRRLDAAVDSLGAGLDVDAAADLDAAADSQRRLAAALPKDWAMPPAQWCREHRHDVYYLSPSVRARTNHTHRHKHADVVTCPPVCLTEDRTNTTQSVKHAPRDEPEAWPDGRRAHWNLWDASDWRDAVAAA